MGADQNFDRHGVAASALDWWQQAGVDVAIDEEPRNWLAPAPVVALASRASVPEASAPPPPVRAPMPGTLGDFTAWRLGPDAPDAGWPGDRLFAQGPADAALMIVLEMPERDDGAAGRLLSGATGVLFDRMLKAIGRDRQSVQLVPMCVVRPTTGRVPPDMERDLAAALRHYVTLSAPQRVLIFGNAASRALIGSDVAQARGALRAVNQSGRELALPVQAVASFHPRFLLERPAAKPEAWKDLQLLIRGMDA